MPDLITAPGLATLTAGDLKQPLFAAIYDAATLLNYSTQFRTHAQSIGGQQNPNGAVLLDVASQLDRIAGRLAEAAVWAYRKETE